MGMEAADYPPRGLVELGYPEDLTELPAPVDELLTPPGLPDDVAAIQRYLHDAGARALLAGTSGWGMGCGRDEVTGEATLVFVVDPDEPARELPDRVEIEGRMVSTSVLHEKRALHTRQAFLDGRARPPYAGGYTGSFISTDPRGILSGSGGTLSGTFGHGGGHRAVTNAHVALNAGIGNLLNNVPNSLGLLFRSPRGRRLIAWDDPLDRFSGVTSGGSSISGFGPGNPYELFRVDTPWPILVPIPFFLPASLSLVFLYVDVAAGDVRPRRLNGAGPGPNPPEPKRTIRGAQLGGATVPLPGQRVYRIGSTSGTAHGSVLLFPFIFVLPIPSITPLLPTQFLIFNVVLYRLDIAEGDSGSLGIVTSGDKPASVDGLGLGATRLGGTNSLSIGTPGYLVELFGRLNL